MGITLNNITSDNIRKFNMYQEELLNYHKYFLDIDFGDYEPEITSLEEVNSNTGLKYKMISIDKIDIGILTYRDNVRSCFICEIYIKKYMRNKGIAKKVLLYLKEIYGEVNLSVYKKNDDAYEKYLKMGFKVTEETDETYKMKL